MGRECRLETGVLGCQQGASASEAATGMNPLLPRLRSTPLVVRKAR